MATNLDLDLALIDEAVAVGGKCTREEAVTAALEEYIARRRQARIPRLFGTIDYDPKYDHKKTASAEMKILIDTSVWSVALGRPDALSRPELS